jgi:glyoxalase-like protein
MTLRIDHIVWGVDDFDRTAAEVQDRYGLASVPGGRHPGWGTANRIIPLGPSYLELLAVVDADEAAADPVGSGYARHIRAAAGLMLWCLATDELDAIAARLGLGIEAKSRVLPDGTSLGWRLVGLPEALENPSLPFFIEWDVVPERHPGRMEAVHAVAPEGIASVTVGADPAELSAWLGGAWLPVRLAGPPGVNSVTVATASGDIVIP